MSPQPGLDILLLAAFIVILVGSWLALRQANRGRRSAQLPAGRIVYADTGNWRPPEKPLFSPTPGLTGKPDYLVETHAGIVPVEVKSGTTPPDPYPSHVLQLAAYCLLTEEMSGQAPQYGLIRYPHSVFRVDYTQALRGELLRVLGNMRADSREAKRHAVHRSHDEPQRCAGCGYRQRCDQSLV